MEVAYTPVLSLQHDWEISLNTKTKDTVWLSSSIYDSQNKKTITKQGEITFVSDAVTSTPPFEVSVVNKELKWLRIKTDTLDTDVYAPTRQLQNPSKQAIRSLGVSPQGGLVVFGSDEGALHVADVQDASIMRTLEGHKGDVTVSKFFPSGQVVLSAALDWRLKIWNLATGDCAATLTGHGGSVLGADFIERGRNIISCSRDGTARLWDVPTQTSISSFSSGSHSAINDCCVFDGYTTTSENKKDEREVGTEGKAIITAGDDGFLRVFDLRAKEQVVNFPSPPKEREGERDEYNCCASAELNSSRLVVGGTESGHIVAWDIRKSSSPLHAVRLTTAPIKKLTFCNEKIWATTGDGSAVGMKWDSSNHSRVSLCVTLSGSDNDPVFGLGVASLVDGHSLVATGARDGVVRLYCNIK